MQTISIKLTEQETAELNKAERILHDLLPLVDMADECGVECERIRGQIALLREQIEALRTNFGSK